MNNEIIQPKHRIDDSEYQQATRELDEIEREIKVIEADLRAAFALLPRAARWVMQRLWPSVFGMA